MAKIKLGPQTLLVPLPVALLTAQLPGEKPNIITLAWVGICCSDPPMIGVGIRSSRYSHRMVMESGQFVINIPSERHIRETDFCGNVSGRKCDKFAETGLTPLPADKVAAPLIKECPINMECVVKHTLKLGSHDYFIAEIIETHLDEECSDTNDKLKVDKLAPVVYLARKRTYYGGLSKVFGDYGFAVRK